MFCGIFDFQARKLDNNQKSSILRIFGLILKKQKIELSAWLLEPCLLRATSTLKNSREMSMNYKLKQESTRVRNVEQKWQTGIKEGAKKFRLSC